MASWHVSNRTFTEARAVHGQDPQNLVEKIIRDRIYESAYWKEHCFALSAVALSCIGGTYANTRPTEFLCLTLKLLQLQPNREIILEYILNDDFKYLRALGAFYFRLTAPELDCYRFLEPLLNDYRKLRRRTKTGFDIIHMDEFVDGLLRDERVCDIILPRIRQRALLEDLGEIEPRESVLE